MKSKKKKPDQSNKINATERRKKTQNIKAQWDIVQANGSCKMEVFLGLVSDTCEDVSFRFPTVLSLHLIGLAQLSYLTQRDIKAMGCLLYSSDYLVCFFPCLCFVPSGNVSDEMVNFCLMTYASGSYSLCIFSCPKLTSKKKITIFPLEFLHIYCGDRDLKWLN